jgi:hypothetical protein
MPSSECLRVGSCADDNLTSDLSQRTRWLLSAGRTDLLFWARVLVLNHDFIQSSIIDTHPSGAIFLLHEQDRGGPRRGARPDVTFLSAHRSAS